MSEIFFENVTAVINDKTRLENVSFRMAAGEQWAVVGANGSGKSSFGRLLCNGLSIISGSFQTSGRTGYVSFEKVSEVLEIERYNDDSDFLDCIDEGTLAGDFILGNDPEKEPQLRELAERLSFTGILDRGIKFLSTGEMRKIVICRALMQEPELLVLDEPFDGLDQASCAALRSMITGCIEKGIRVVLLLNRFSEIVPEISHVAYIKNCRIIMAGAKNDLLQSEALRRLHAFHYTLPAAFPEVDCFTSTGPLPAGVPLVVMNGVTVRYGEKIILNGLNWTVRPGEHWKISGPNGAGKSTLLSLISGDHPQAYANDITLFGIRKGSGESVWDIKKRIGLVSTSLQQEYRVSVTAKGAVLSGLFDSIGVYTDTSKKQHDIAKEWLAILHLEKLADAPFKSLSYGEQRLVLLARAMVKQPDLLILDEPCQGLDDVNREMVLKLIDHLGRRGRTQILYVTHHPEDDLPCITNSMQLVASAGGGFTAQVDP
ncbi:MAG TPA: molybdate ABC transporter ATP-binding protein ModF [Geomonas sp.]|nr:molybdate ABC transporter ATP-binding protein ModF [Geomonas sp.]